MENQPVEKVIQVQVITPDGIVYNHHADFLTVRTTGGDMGILPEMASTIAGLAIDELKVRRIGNDHFDTSVDYIAVNGGVVEIMNSTVTIVADSAERDRDIDLSRAERAKLRAEKTVQIAGESKDPDEFKRAQVALQRAINRIGVAKHL